MSEPLSWRDYLTEDERAIIEAGDAAKEEWQCLNLPRAGIVNRAIARARYAAKRAEPQMPRHDVVPLSRQAEHPNDAAEATILLEKPVASVLPVTRTVEARPNFKRSTLAAMKDKA